MGRFDLTPRKGETYTLAATDPADVELAGASLTAAADGVSLRALDDVVEARPPLATGGHCRWANTVAGGWI